MICSSRHLDRVPRADELEVLHAYYCMEWSLRSTYDYDGVGRSISIRPGQDA
jgi:hypothetical protein